MMRRILPNSTYSPPARGGTTLMEVLMALLVLSVGITSLAVMFPLAILRSIEATKLTSATMLRYNVEELIDAFPDLVFNPDNDTNYAERAGTNYIIDPWGEAVLTPLAGGPVNFADIATLERFGATINGTVIPQNEAADFVTSGDNWNTLLDDAVDIASWVNTVDSTATPPEPKITFPGAFAATGLTAVYVYAVGDPIYRVVFFDSTGKRSHVRLLTQIAVDDTLSWDDPLPSGFAPVTAWLQVRQAQYSWFLTVRRNPSTNAVLVGMNTDRSDESAEIDIVTFFRRSIENDEPFPLPTSQFAESAYDLVAPGFQFGVNNITVQWDETAGEPAPFIKEGGFVFDPHNAYWYRILSTTEDVAATRVLLNLDRSADANSPAPVGGVVVDGAVFLKGIVNVYPIIGKTIHWDDPNVP